MSTNTMRPPAQTIVYRHACNCDTANQPPGGHPEHRFDVDGQPFPWLITEAGATFKRLDPLTSVYICTVTILDIDPETHEPTPICFYTGWPDIGGKPFPWQIMDCYPKFIHGAVQLTVSFVADRVDTDGDIADAWASSP